MSQGRNAKPVLEHGGVDLPKVNGHLQISLGQITKAGSLGMEARPDVGASEEDGASGAVVCPNRRVLFHSPTEFAERRQQHALAMPMLGDVADERRRRVAQFAKQRRMRRRLIGVRVEPVVRNVINPRAHAGVDQLGDAMDQCRRFARPSSGDDQKRPVTVRRRLALWFI